MCHNLSVSLFSGIFDYSLAYYLWWRDQSYDRWNTFLYTLICTSQWNDALLWTTSPKAYSDFLLGDDSCSLLNRFVGAILTPIVLGLMVFSSYLGTWYYLQRLPTCLWVIGSIGALSEFLNFVDLTLTCTTCYGQVSQHHSLLLQHFVVYVRFHTFSYILIKGLQSLLSSSSLLHGCIHGSSSQCTLESSSSSRSKSQDSSMNSRCWSLSQKIRSSFRNKSMLTS